MVSKLKIRLLIILLVILIFVVGLYFYLNSISANVIWDKSVNKLCSGQITIANSDREDQIRNIEESFGIKYPETENQKEFSVDMDTYAKSWSDTADKQDEEENYKNEKGEEINNDQITKSVTTEEVADKNKLSNNLSDNAEQNNEQIRLRIRSRLPEIIAEINNIYGLPYKKNKVVVIYLPDFENSNINNIGMDNASGFYNESIDAMFLTSSIINENNGISKLFIHELIHAYNDGSLPIEAYEEGMVEATANIVAAKLDKDYQYEYKDSEGREVLKNIAGLFRTFDDSVIVNERYVASAKYFDDKLKENSKYLINFRTKYSKTDYFKGKKIISRKFGRLVRTNSDMSMSRNPMKYMQYIIAKTACDEMSGYLSELRQYLSTVQNLIHPGLGNLKKNKQVEDLITKYPILDILPEENLYPNKAKIYTDLQAFNDYLGIRSTYKVSTIQDAIPQIYHYVFNGQKTERFYNIHKEMPRLLSKLSNTQLLSNMRSLQDLEYIIEQSSDEVKYTFYDSTMTKEFFSGEIKNNRDMKKVATRYIEINTIKNTGHLSEDFSGEIILKLDSKITVDRGKRRYKCLNFLIGKTCYTDGFMVNEQKIESTDYKKIIFLDGKVQSIDNNFLPEDKG